MLVLLAGVLFPLSLLGIDPEHRDKAYFGWFLFLEAAVMGTFLSLDMFLFFVCFEISLVPLYFLIGGWGHGEKVKAATKFFLYISESCPAPTSSARTLRTARRARRACRRAAATRCRPRGRSAAPAG